jgi:hypothetical protein
MTQENEWRLRVEDNPLVAVRLTMLSQVELILYLRTQNGIHDASLIAGDTGYALDFNWLGRQYTGRRSGDKEIG